MAQPRGHIKNKVLDCSQKGQVKAKLPIPATNRSLPTTRPLRNGEATNLYLYHSLLIFLLLVSVIDAAAQAPDKSSKGDPLPQEVRGYKVYRARIDLKRIKESDTKNSNKKSEKNSEKEEYDEVEPLFIRLGEAKLVSVTPLGVTFDVPVIIPPVKQQGKVDLLVFEDMTVNETPVDIEDHVNKFELPNKQPLTLARPLRVFVSTPQAVLTTIDEFLNSKEVWPLTGRVYVCGHFKKYLLKFKRAVPVELATSIKNPLR